MWRDVSFFLSLPTLSLSSRSRLARVNNDHRRVASAANATNTGTGSGGGCGTDKGTRGDTGRGSGIGAIGGKVVLTEVWVVAEAATAAAAAVSTT